jgi:hypothetical protein
MFLTATILNYINSGEHPNIGKCLIQVLDRSDQLNDDQVCGAVAAAVALNGSCWAAAQSILTNSFSKHENLHVKLQQNLCKIMGERYAKWLSETWRVACAYQIALIKNLVAGLNYDASLTILNFAAVINATPSLKFISRCEKISTAPRA